MNNFRDVSALHRVLQAVHQDQPGEAGRGYFAQALETHFGFNKQQADLYASTVLTRSAEGSADWVTMHAGKVAGTWIRIKSEGLATGWLNSMQETWRFADDLTYEHKREGYEGYTSPFGSSYSRPSSSGESGIWAPSDTEQNDSLYLVIIPASGVARTLRMIWSGDKPFFPRQCSIDGLDFSRHF